MLRLRQQVVGSLDCTSTGSTSLCELCAASANSVCPSAPREGEKTNYYISLRRQIQQMDYCGPSAKMPWQTLARLMSWQSVEPSITGARSGGCNPI